MTIMRTIIAVAALAAPAAATAQAASVGEAEYVNSCAQCHGLSGEGDGVIAGFLDTSLPDLGMLTQENDGVFPVSRIYSIIDGTAASGIHGTSEMPAWGMRYMAQAPERLGEFYRPGDPEALVRARILALVEYISTLQK